jgi:hypothetical protein
MEAMAALTAARCGNLAAGGEATMKFEVFDKRLAPLTKAPVVTIQKRGVISLNRAAYALIGEAATVELLYDRDERVIGIRPVADDVPHGYPVRPQSTTKTTGPLLIAGTAFTQFYGVDTATTRRWTPTMLDNILCIDLKQPGTPIVGNRSSKTLCEQGEEA